MSDKHTSHNSKMLCNMVSGDIHSTDISQPDEQGRFAANSEVKAMLSPRTIPNLGVKSGTAKDNTGTQPATTKEVVPQQVSQERPRASNENVPNRTAAPNGNSSAPATK